MAAPAPAPAPAPSRACRAALVSDQASGKPCDCDRPGLGCRFRVRELRREAVLEGVAGVLLDVEFDVTSTGECFADLIDLRGRNVWILATEVEEQGAGYLVRAVELRSYAASVVRNTAGGITGDRELVGEAPTQAVAEDGDEPGHLRNAFQVIESGREVCGGDGGINFGEALRHAEGALQTLIVVRAVDIPFHAPEHVGAEHDIALFTKGQSPVADELAHAEDLLQEQDACSVGVFRDDEEAVVVSVGCRDGLRSLRGRHIGRLRATALGCPTAWPFSSTVTAMQERVCGSLGGCAPESRSSGIDLALASVFLDFDGTITLEDTGLYLLERLASPEWHEIEDRYVAGEIGSRQCMAGEWATLPHDRALAEAVVAEVPLDEGFGPLVEYLRGSGAEVCILSDGFGFRAEAVGAEVGIPVITNCIDWDSWEVGFPNGDLSCECAACGACKRSPIRDARARGRATVLVGDGTSDMLAASVADVVFATGKLAHWCESSGLAFERFSRLAQVQRGLAGMSREGVLAGPSPSPSPSPTRADE